MSYRLVASDPCTDGNCPSFLIDESTLDVIVRGEKDGDPTTEVDLRFPPDQFRRFVAQYLAGGA